MLEGFDLLEIIVSGFRNLLGKQRAKDKEPLETGQNVVASIIAIGLIALAIGIPICWLIAN
ncbi:hypothetical protein OAS39_11550 [Pirellulales bacterium]|nr:hypothetical protein [Pirellulales bacterium]